MMSGVGKPDPYRGAPGDASVRLELRRILATDLFQRSARLSAFLRFVTERTLAGESAMLKEQVLGSELYGKGPEFDGGTDPVVRVDARRLRDKLREYYAASPLDPVVISLSKGCYVPAFEVNGKTPPPNAGGATAPRQPLSFRRRGAAMAAGLAVLLGCLAWSTGRKTPSRLTRITTFQGNKVAPGLSPDG